MRQLLLAGGVLCAAGLLAHWAAAQNQAMPGQVVGTGLNGINFSPVGTQFPKAGAPAGQPVNLPAETPFLRRADPNNPLDAFRGTSIDPKTIVGGVPGGSQSAVAQFYDKLKAAVGLSAKPAPPPSPNVTPGIFRRNRERIQERMWRRD